MAYTDEEKRAMFDKVCLEVSKGKAVRNVLDSEGYMQSNMFYELVDSSTEFSQQYARACEARADAIFEETIDISDNREGDTYEDKDGNIQVDHAVVARDRLRVDTRKWAASKLQPRKYGDKLALDHTSKDGSMSPGIDLSQYPPEVLQSIRKTLHEADKKKAEEEAKKK